MKHIVFKPILTLMLMALALAGSAYATSKTADSNNKGLAAKAGKKANHGSQVKFLPGSAETTKERSTRLKRECRGRVNAGACAGYTY